MAAREWTTGEWTVPPVDLRFDGPDLLATAEKGSDAWRTTAHGYITDNAHALLAPLADGEAVEVDFVAELPEQFDQAGLMVRADEAQWIKAGADFADGTLQLGAVVTRDASDWSSSPIPDWAGKTVTISASRSGDAILIRARVAGEPVPPHPGRLVRSDSRDLGRPVPCRAQSRRAHRAIHGSASGRGRFGRAPGWVARLRALAPYCSAEVSRAIPSKNVAEAGSFAHSSGVSRRPASR